MNNKEKLLDRIAKLEEENKALHEKILRQASYHGHPINIGQVVNKEKLKDYKAIFDYSASGNITLSQNMDISHANQAFISMLGYNKRDDVTGKKIMDFTCPQQREDWNLLHYNLWVKNNNQFNFKTSLNKRDNTIIWCDVNCLSIMENGVSHSYTTFSDVTELGSLHENLQQVVNLQQIHLFAHDVKNPLHNIKTVSGFLKMNVKRSDSKLACRTQFLSFISLILNYGKQLIRWL